MADFEFLENPLSKKWVILAPHRALRPDVAKGSEPICPFCVGREKEEKELYRVGGEFPDANWKLRVIPNKFPFAPIHEIIIHSPDHHKNFGELTLDQTEIILNTYRQRYNTHSKAGQVYIFHNRGEAGGESLPHPHTQLTVVPSDVELDMPALILKDEELKVLSHFYIFCPNISQWPDEVWVAPKREGRSFHEATNDEIKEVAFIVSRLVQIFTLRHGHDFPFNFYIFMLRFFN